MKEKQIPKKKKRSSLKIGLGILTLVGLISIGVAVGVGFRPWEKPKAPETKKMVSVRIIDVHYKGKILENNKEKEKGKVPVNPAIGVKTPADPLSVRIEEGTALPKESLESEEEQDEKIVASEDVPAQTPSELKEKLTAVVATLEQVQFKGKAAAAEPPEIEQKDLKPRPTITKSKPAANEMGPFTVQVGVFRNKTYAERKASKLKALNYPVFIHEVVGKDDQIIYLVCFGRFKTRENTVPAVAGYKEKEKMDAVVAFLK